MQLTNLHSCAQALGETAVDGRPALLQNTEQRIEAHRMSFDSRQGSLNVCLHARTPDWRSASLSAAQSSANFCSLHAARQSQSLPKARNQELTMLQQLLGHQQPCELLFATERLCCQGFAASRVCSCQL